MAWTAPMTAISGSIFTAAQFNTFVRDNLLECPAAKATTTGSIFVSDSTNHVVERVTQQSTIATAETTSSTSFVDLATIGPVVTVTTGSKALIFISARINVSVTANTAGIVGCDISGATTEAPSNTHVLRSDAGTTNTNRATAVRFHDSLTPGSNTFKMMYEVNAGTATGQFAARHLIVVPM